MIIKESRGGKKSKRKLGKLLKVDSSRALNNDQAFLGPRSKKIEARIACQKSRTRNGLLLTSLLRPVYHVDERPSYVTTALLLPSLTASWRISAGVSSYRGIIRKRGKEFREFFLDSRGNNEKNKFRIERRMGTGNNN